MTDTTRDLIRRLADELTNAIRVIHSEDGTHHISTAAPVLDEARAYLAQPEPEGPTDEELEEFALKHGGGYFNCDCQAEADILTRKHVSNYRAVLARWGRPAIQPKPEELTDEEIEKSFQLWWLNEGGGMRPSNGEDQEEHVRRVSQIAWSNGAYVARCNRPTTTQGGTHD